LLVRQFGSDCICAKTPEPLKLKFDFRSGRALAQFLRRVIVYPLGVCPDRLFLWDHGIATTRGSNRPVSGHAVGLEAQAEYVIFDGNLNKPQKLFATTSKKIPLRRVVDTIGLRHDYQ
jgi:hypothetical protein